MAQIRRLMIAAIIQLFCFNENGLSAERFFISIPGPTLSYAHLYYTTVRSVASLPRKGWTCKV
jgi:hypothetical protein